MQQEVRPDRLARVASIDQLLSVAMMPIGQALAGALAAGLGVPATQVLAGPPMCVPNLIVLTFVHEVRSVRRRDEPSPALAA